MEWVIWKKLLQPILIPLYGFSSDAQVASPLNQYPQEERIYLCIHLLLVNMPCRSNLEKYN